MKITLVKETKLNGIIVYYTRVDGRFVDNSLELYVDKAKIIYDNIVKNNGVYNGEEVLESVEI
jgi:hypothetical protein